MDDRRGRLYGVGIGPGDPELLTLKALRLLREASVIAYPAPERGASFARSIVRQWLDGSRPEIAIRFPMQPGPVPTSLYDGAAAALSAQLDRGHDVAMLCQGDPLFYGSFIQLFARLARRFSIEIVPGVSSLGACAAAAGIPLATRDETLVVVPATLDEPALVRRILAAETVAIVKVGRHLAKVQRVVRRLGLIDQAIYIERATTPNQRVAPFAEIETATAAYFSMLIIRQGARSADSGGECVAADFDERILFLFRHGETDWNREGRVQGHADVPLNGTGIGQAEALVERLRPHRLEAIVSSDLARARATARIVADALAIPLMTDRGLRETNVGAAEGLLWSEAKARFGEGLTERWYRDDNTAFPGGETGLATRGRGLEALRRFTLAHRYRRIGVATHGAMVRQLMKHALPPGSPPATAHNTVLHILRYEPATDRLGLAPDDMIGGAGTPNIIIRTAD
jgi:precorrin-2/cobalt-factor-2 C20-methyltransferase